MVKRRYEKPEMLVETFIATQSVALNCGLDFTHAPLELIDGKHICSQPTCGHDVKYNGIKSFDDINNGGNGDNKVTLFNADNGCELVYEKYDINVLGGMMIGNSSWNSDTHAMVIDGVQIPSA